MEELSLYQKLEIWIKKRLPFVLSLVFVIVSTIPFNVEQSIIIKPFLGIICVFYWGVFRPDIFGYKESFVIGLFEDLIGSTPLGVSSLVYLLVYSITIDQRRYLTNRPFQVTWAGFALVSFFATIIQYILCSIIYAKFTPVSVCFINYLVLTCLYPVISFVCAKLQTKSLKEI